MSNKYTICILFKSKENILLIRKNKTIYKGLLNGIGGKIEPNETPIEGAKREIFEETGMSNIKNLTWLGTLILPYDCKTEQYQETELHFYTGIITEPWQQQPNEEALELHNINKLKPSQLAGNGNLKYFINRAYSAMFGKGQNL